MSNVKKLRCFFAVHRREDMLAAFVGVFSLSLLSPVRTVVGASPRASGPRMQLEVPPPQAPLVIVGAGVLGRLIASQWREAQGASPGVVYGITRRDDEERASEMRAEGMTPITSADACGPDACEEVRCAHVVFCASPGGNDDYPAAVSAALKLWERDEPGSRFIFTSSAGVYAEDSGARVDELAPIGDSARVRKLIAAEKAVVEAGGTVLRLAGLYLLERGAHKAYLSREEVDANPDGLINQIHYADAASAVVAALLRGGQGETLHAADDSPLSREEICVQARRARIFADRQLPRFGTAGGAGKVIDSTYTRKAIGWEPRYKTFQSFIEAEGDCSA